VKKFGIFFKDFQGSLQYQISLKDSLNMRTHRDRRTEGGSDGRTDIRTDIYNLTCNKRVLKIGKKSKNKKMNVKRQRTPAELRADDYKLEAIVAGYCAGFGGFGSVVSDCFIVGCWAP
jgi:hypothetical protein